MTSRRRKNAAAMKVCLIVIRDDWPLLKMPIDFVTVNYFFKNIKYTTFTKEYFSRRSSP
jgi:hypothetical protein